MRGISIYILNQNECNRLQQYTIMLCSADLDGGFCVPQTPTGSWLISPLTHCVFPHTLKKSSRFSQDTLLPHPRQSQWHLSSREQWLSCLDNCIFYKCAFRVVTIHITPLIYILWQCGWGEATERPAWIWLLISHRKSDDLCLCVQSIITPRTKTLKLSRKIQTHRTNSCREILISYLLPVLEGHTQSKLSRKGNLFSLFESILKSINHVGLLFNS